MGYKDVIASTFTPCAAAPASVWTECGALPSLTGWVSRVSAADNDWFGVAYAPEIDVLVAVGITGGGARLMRSTDKGVTWTTPVTALSNDDWRDVIRCNPSWAPGGIFIACAATGAQRIATSPDGLTWTLVTVLATQLVGLAYDAVHDKVVAVSATTLANQNLYTSNGTVWTAAVSPISTSIGVGCSTSGQLVAVGIGPANRIIYSNDGGVNWLVGTAPQANSYVSVTWAPWIPLWIAVSTDGTNRVFTAPDAAGVWTPQAATANAWRAVRAVTDIQRVIAVAVSGVGNRAMRSANGTAWTDDVSAADNDWRALCYVSVVPRRLVAVASTGVGNRVMTNDVA